MFPHDLSDLRKGSRRNSDIKIQKWVTAKQVFSYNFLTTIRDINVTN